MTDGMSAVVSRIQDIRSRIATVAPTAVRPTVTTSAYTLAAEPDSSSFADSLSSALGTEGWDSSGTTTGATSSSGAVSSGAAAASPTTASTSASSSANTAGERVVEDAKRYLGVPYVWGGTNPKTGLECSGLVQQVYQDLGIDLPRVSRDQARAGRPVASVADAKPGDVVAFGSPVDHVGIYVGDGKMIAAPYPGRNVRIEPLPSTPTAIRRILPDSAVTTTTRTWSSAGAAPPSTRSSSTPYGGLFAAATAKYDLPRGLLAAVAKAESGFDSDAVSSAGARGLMQLMPATARGLGVDPFSPAEAVDGAARLLRSNLHDFGSVPLALAAYNAGPGAVRRYGGVPPYAETQAYVAKVQTYQEELA